MSLVLLRGAYLTRVDLTIAIMLKRKHTFDFSERKENLNQQKGKIRGARAIIQWIGHLPCTELI